MLKNFQLTKFKKNIKRDFIFNYWFYKKNKEKYDAIRKEWEEKNKKVVQGTGKFEGSIYSQYSMNEMLEGKFIKSPLNFEVVGKKFPKIGNIENLTQTSTSMFFKQQRSIVIIATSGTAQKFADSWVEAVKKHTDKKYKLFQMLMVDRNFWFFKMFKRYSINQLKKVYPPEDHENFFIGFGSYELEKKELKLEVSATCYVYFVDGFGRITWKATGKPDEFDVEMLNKFLIQD
jgi:hypothetical protein